MPGKVPRPFKLHWGGGRIVEEAWFEGEHHVPAIQLLEFDDGSESVRFCFFSHKGSFMRDPVVLSAPELAGLRDALRQTPRLRKLLASLVR
jgi:hypothetical protein